jgi:hypothetical protein
MKRWLGVFCAAAALMLGSATPPHRMKLDTAGLEDLDCGRAGARCALLATGEGALVAVATPPDAAALAALEAESASPPPVPKPPTPAPVDTGVAVVISLPQQRAYVFRDDDLFATTPVSTGRRGHETPAGIFHIMEKAVHHRSNIYSNAPMPFMERLTASGIALHAGRLPGYPASHGCIRLPWGFAKRLFAITRSGTRVVITRRRLRSAMDAFQLA